SAARRTRRRRTRSNEPSPAGFDGVASKKHFHGQKVISNLGAEYPPATQPSPGDSRVATIIAAPPVGTSWKLSLSFCSQVPFSEASALVSMAKRAVLLGT